MSQQSSQTDYSSIRITREILPYLMSIDELAEQLGARSLSVSIRLNIKLVSQYGPCFVKGSDILFTMSNAGKYSIQHLKDAVVTMSHIQFERAIKELCTIQIDSYNVQLVNRDIDEKSFPDYNKRLEPIVNQPIQAIHVQILKQVPDVFSKLGEYLLAIRCFNPAFDAVPDSTILEIHYMKLSSVEKGKKLLEKMVEHKRITVKGFINLLSQFSTTGIVIQDIIRLLDREYYLLKYNIESKWQFQDPKNVNPPVRITQRISENRIPENRILNDREEEIRALKKRLEEAESQARIVASQMARLKVNEKKDDEEDQDSSETECVICMNARRNRAFLPCGHLCCCERCAERITRCPMCTGVIDKKIKIFQ